MYSCNMKPEQHRITQSGNQSSNLEILLPFFCVWQAATDGKPPLLEMLFNYAFNPPSYYSTPFQ